MAELAFSFVSSASCICSESYVPLFFQPLYNHSSSVSIYNLLENAVPCGTVFGVNVVISWYLDHEQEKTSGPLTHLGLTHSTLTWPRRCE